MRKFNEKLGRKDRKELRKIQMDLFEFVQEDSWKRNINGFIIIKNKKVRSLLGEYAWFRNLKNIKIIFARDGQPSEWNNWDNYPIGRYQYENDASVSIFTNMKHLKKYSKAIHSDNSIIDWCDPFDGEVLFYFPDGLTNANTFKREQFGYGSDAKLHIMLKQISQRGYQWLCLTNMTSYMQIVD